MTGREYLVKFERLDAQIQSAGVKLGTADMRVQTALTPKLDDLVWAMDEFRGKAQNIVAADALDFRVAIEEEEALNMAGAALAALMAETDKHLSHVFGEADDGALRASFNVGIHR